MNRFSYALIVLMLLLLSCAGPASRHSADCPTPAACPPANARLLHAYFAAYNSGDLATIRQLLHRNVTWLSIKEDTVVVEYHGRDALLDVIRDYQSDGGSVSSIATLDTTGPWVYVREIVSWDGPRGPQQQAALSVYQIENERIRRVWYYPAVALPAPD